MNKLVLSQEIQVTEDKVVITEEVETSIDVITIQQELADIFRKKSRLKEQGNQLIERYNELVVKEEELNNYLNKIKSVDFPIIK